MQFFFIKVYFCFICNPKVELFTIYISHTLYDLYTNKNLQKLWALYIHMHVYMNICDVYDCTYLDIKMNIWIAIPKLSNVVHDRFPCGLFGHRFEHSIKVRSPETGPKKKARKRVCYVFLPISLQEKKSA